MKIKLIKINKVEDADCPTPDFTDYKPGMDNGLVSLPIDYEICGEIGGFPVVGNSIIGTRTHRNGIEVPGIFTTSKVISVISINEEEYIITTKNSIYKMFLEKNSEKDEKTLA